MKWPWWEETPRSEAEHASRRLHMVETQLERRHIHDARVLAAMRQVPRHLFVPERFRGLAYDDAPAPLGFEQTVSQPFIVAYMLQWLKLTGGERVLEIGTGSGYQTALLAQLCKKVYSIEIIPALAAAAKSILTMLALSNIHIRCGDGYPGWKVHAPFDRIIISAAPSHVPKNLLNQLEAGGRMILPLGDFNQHLLLVRKSQTGKVHRRELASVKFVPMTGLAEKVN